MEKNIKCLIDACKKISLKYEFIGNEDNFLRINVSGKWEYFQLNKTPFNSEVTYGICKDKMHTYKLLHPRVRMPKTISFLDFGVEKKYQHYVRHTSLSAVMENIETELTYPLIIKQNKGALGVNVYLCKNKESVSDAIQAIFNKASKYYDYILLAQQFIPTREEYRLVCAFGQPVLAYKRGNAHIFNHKYWENNEVAILIKDPKVIQDLFGFIEPVYQDIDLGFVGFDIVRGMDNRFYLIELNSSPKFDHIIDSSGEESVIQMYEQSLSLFHHKHSPPLWQCF